MLKDRAKINVAVDTLDVDNVVTEQSNKDNIQNFAEWLAASAAHDAFYLPHPQSGLMYKRNMSAIQFLCIMTQTGREMIHIMMEDLRNAPAGHNIGNAFRTFVFIVDFSLSENDGFADFLNQELESNMMARVLTEFIVVDFNKGTYFKISGGKVNDKHLRKVLESTHVAVNMTEDTRSSQASHKIKSFNNNLAEMRTKKENKGLLFAVLAIVLINVTVFVIDYIFMTRKGEMPIEAFGIQYNRLVWEGEWWRLITSVFLHSDVSHLSGNMIMLLLISRLLRNFYSGFQYCVIYLITGIVGSLFTLFFMEEEVLSLGASGAVMGIGGVLIFRMFFGHNAHFLRRISNCITIIVMIVYNLAFGLTQTDVNNWAHFSGFITGFLLACLIHVYQKKKEKNNNKNLA